MSLGIRRQQLAECDNGRLTRNYGQITKFFRGPEAVVYSVPASSTLSSIAAGVSSAINTDSNLASLGVTATTNGRVSATIGGTITAGDTLTIQSTGGGLSSPVNSTYTVLSGDTTSSVASGLATAIDGNSSLQTAGITGQSAASIVNVNFNPQNAPVYLGAVTSGATEKICLAMNSNVNKLVLVGGTKTTGDVVSFTVFDSGLSGSQTTVNYTVLSTDTLATIASGIASAMNSSTDLQNIGVSASASSDILTVQSNSVNITAYGQSTSSGATETVTIGLNPNGTQPATIGGTKSTGDVLTLLVCDAGLSGGQESVSYTVQSSDTLPTVASGMASAIDADTALSVIGVSATAVSTVVNIKSVSTNATTYTQSVSSGATETVSLIPGMSVIGDSYNNLNQVTARSSAGVIHFEGSTNKPVKSVGFNSSQVNIQYSRPAQTITYTTNGTVFEVASTTPGVTSFYVNIPNYVGYPLSITAHNDLLPGGQETATYVVQSGDTYPEMAANLATAINNDSELQTLGLSAAGTGIISYPYSFLGISVLSPTYTGSTSSGASENVLVSRVLNGNSIVSVGGFPTAGDTVTITAHFPSLPSGQESVAYTVLAGDKLSDIASALSTLINADTNLSALDISSTANDSSSATLSTAEKFTGKPLLSGNSATTVSAVDGDNNVKANVYQTSVTNSPSNQNLVYDLNGNLTFDGTNTYSWDAENRLTQITYQGTNNFSTFTFDGFGECVKIIETTGGSITNTKQFVRTANGVREARDASGTLTAQYFSLGQTSSGANYYYHLNQRGDVVGVTDSSGNQVASMAYDPYGRPTVPSGSFTPDFGFTGLYVHQRSALNLAVYRVYSSGLGRWLNRDPIEESGGTNLYAYGGNMPTQTIDPLGLFYDVVVTGPGQVRVDVPLTYPAGYDPTNEIDDINNTWSNTWGDITITMHAYSGDWTQPFRRRTKQIAYRNAHERTAL